MIEKIFDILKIVLPAAMVLVGIMITNKTNVQRFKEEKEKLKLENDLQQHKKKEDELLLNKKELFKLMQYIRSGFSVTQNYRMQELNVSWEKFDLHYAEMNQLSLQAQLISHMYFPILEEKVDEICSLVNLAWGQQKKLFLQCDGDKQHVLNEFVKYSLKIDEKCRNTMKDIVKISSEKNLKVA